MHDPTIHEQRSTPAWRRLLDRFCSGLLDQVYPRRCPGCRVRLSAPAAADQAGWCGPCAGTVFHLDAPGCSICAAPRPRQIGRTYRGVDDICPRCAERRPYFERVDSLFEYVGAVADAIQFIKYAPATWPIRVLEPPFRRWLDRRVASLNYPLVTTVPMHRRDLARRGFHLMEVMLHRAARQSPALSSSRLLKKTRYTSPQAGLTLGERLRNVRDVFEVAPDTDVADRDVIVVDDVVTTGATADAAARALVEAGSRRVFVYSVARAPRS